MLTRDQLLEYAFKGLKEVSTYTKTVAPFLHEMGFSDADLDSIEEEYEVVVDTQRVWIDRCLKKAGIPIAFLQTKRLRDSCSFRKDKKKTMRAAKKAKVSMVIFTSGDVWEMHRAGTLVCHHNLLNNYDVGVSEIKRCIKNYMEDLK